MLLLLEVPLDNGKEVILKNKLFSALFFVIVVILTTLVWICIDKHLTKMDFANEGIAVFIYEDTDSTQMLSKDDVIFIKNIFDGKLLYKDSPACGFTENISIIFNNSQTFCIACDTCPLIYWKEKDMYFRLSETEREQLCEKLKSYGFFFPCT